MRFRAGHIFRVAIAAVPVILLTGVDGHKALAAPVRHHSASNKGSGSGTRRPSGKFAHPAGAWTFDVGASHLWESNINYMPKGITAESRVLSVGAHYAADLGHRRKINADGRIRDYHYAHRPNLDRQFQRIEVTFKTPILGRLHSETRERIDKNSVSDDHLLTDEFSLRERLTYRIDHAVHLYGDFGHRERHYQDFKIRNSAEPALGCGLMLRLPRSREPLILMLETSGSRHA